MKNKMYGYIRVSSVGQNDARQLVELKNYGVPESNIFSDYVSGKDFNREGYINLKSKLDKNDLLVLKSLDRLGRNYDEIIKEWKYLTQKIEADIVVLDMPLLNTTTNKDLIGTLISDIVLQLLSYVAQTERDLIHKRQAEGIAVAKSMGKHLGRKENPFPKNFNKVYQKIIENEITKKEGAELLKIRYHTMLRYCKRKELDFNIK